MPSTAGTVLFELHLLSLNSSLSTLPLFLTALQCCSVGCVAKGASHLSVNSGSRAGGHDSGGNERCR